MVAVLMEAPDGVDDGSINRMNTHKDDFEERHDFRLFGLHIFVNGNFNFFEYLHLILMFYDSLSHYRGSGCKGKGGGVRTCFIG